VGRARLGLRHPRPVLPRGIVSHVLRVAALEISHPVAGFVLMETDDAARHARAGQRVGSSYSPNSFPTGSVNAANAPIPPPMSVRGVFTLPPAETICFSVSAMESTMM
jgi:hypothetical protein